MVRRTRHVSEPGRRRVVHPPNRVEFATTRLSTGLRVHYAEQGDRGGEAILFLHAYADSWFSYARLLPLLSPTYHAIVPDQRGHGNSGKPECCYAADDYVADVNAFMEAVGIERATLVGDSSGGLIAQRMALDHPHRVGRLVLIGSPTTLVGNASVAAAKEEILALEDPIPPGFVERFVQGTVRDPVPEEFLVGVVSESLKVPARVWRGYYENLLLAVDDTSRFGEIGAPTLILWGEQDALLPREEQERRAAAIPNAALKAYPKTGHLAHWVRPEWVVRDLEAFMKETSMAS
jgi:non-heme chloroperoxidase